MSPKKSAVSGVARDLVRHRQDLAMRAMLVEIQRARFHEPDSDRYEYCSGCGRSPHNVPPHTDDCVVVRLGRLLREGAPASGDLSPTARRALRGMLVDLQQIRFHEPDSDRYEYCSGCDRSPYNVPPHAEGCVVVRLGALLREIDLGPRSRRGAR